MKVKEETVTVTLSVPISIWSFFEEWAREALEDDCCDINKLTLARRRSEIMIDILRDVYKKRS